MVKMTILVTNQAGLYAKPAALFVQTAGKFSSHIWIEKDGSKVNAKSIMALMSLAISKGCEIIISAEGEDEHQAVKELTGLIASLHDE